MKEPVAQLHGSEKSMILSPLARMGETHPINPDGGLPIRAGEAAMTREGPVDLRSAEQVSEGEPARRGVAQEGSKERCCAPKSCATGSKAYTLLELAEKTGSTLVGDPDFTITGVDTLEEATPEDASFLSNPRYREAMAASQAGVVCVDWQTATEGGKRYLVSDNPSRAFQIIAELIHRAKHSSSFKGIHPTAILGPGVELGEGVSIGPYAALDQGCSIGAGTVIGAHVSIGADVKIGERCVLHPSCVVREGCLLGNRVILQSGAVIGSCGFGYTTDATGRHHKLEQIGIVVIEDDVEIGANSTIDRARFKATVIRRGTKIDNLVQIAHNVEVGPDNLIAAQTGIAGSAKTGRLVMLGGQVGVLGHVELEDMVMIATRGGVSKSLKAGKYRGSPAIPLPEYNRQEVHVRRLEEYVERIKSLEKKVAELQGC